MLHESLKYIVCFEQRLRPKKMLLLMLAGFYPAVLRSNSRLEFDIINIFPLDLILYRLNKCKIVMQVVRLPSSN